MIRKIGTICGFWWVFIAPGTNVAQDFQVSNVVPRAIVQLRDCGLKMNVLASLVQFSKKEDVFFIISHLGKEEKVTFGRRRLFNLKTYFTDESLQKFRKNPELVVIAEGEPVVGDGRIDIYIDGILEARFVLEKNSDFYLGDCGAGVEYKPCSLPYDRLFFPCKKT